MLSMWKSGAVVISYLSSASKTTFNWLTGSNSRARKRKGKSPNRVVNAAVAGPSKTSSAGFLYAFEIYPNSYKVGKTVNVSQRVRAYKTIHPQGYVHHQVACGDIHHSERILHDMLKLHGYPNVQEIFEVPGKTIVAYMDFVASLDKVLNEQNEVQNLSKITHFCAKISN